MVFRAGQSLAASRRRRLASVAASCLVATAMLGLALPSAAGANKVPFQRGVTVGEWGPTAYAPAATEQTLRRLKKKYGARSVTFFVVWKQGDETSTTIRRDGAVRDDRLINAIRAARKLGLKVVLRPYIDRDDGGWRGELEPSSVSAWFASYREFILTYARIAQRERVKGFIVGSELKSLEGPSYTAYWRSIISAVRQVYRKGFLTYQANWDSFDNVRFWGDLDVIDISAYYPVASQLDYSVSDLVEGWRKVEVAIDSVRQQVGKPVMFGELGYRTVEGTATRPWDVDLKTAYSVQAQKRAYQAALRVWYRVRWFRGFQWWYVPTQPSFVAGKRGADHAPVKPTRKVLKRWYRKRR